MTLESALTYFVAIFVFAITPGPGIFALLAKGLTQEFLISASNPKVILFYIAFLPTFIDLTTLNHGDMLLVAGLTLVGLMMGLMLVASFASSARRFFQSERAQKGTNRTAGSLMLAAGAFLIAKG